MKHLLALLFSFVGSFAFGQSGSGTFPPDPPTGYSWSDPLPKPAPLVFNSRQCYGPANAAGLYDYAIETVGDNWCVSNLSPIATLNQPAGANASIRYSAPSTEPSCGFLVWRRGPYIAGTAEAQRGQWKVGGPENAGPWPMTSMPIHTWHAGDFRRYWFDGWAYGEALYFSQDGPLGTWYKRTQAIGPLRLDGTRQPIPDPTNAPDLTLLSAVPNQNVFVAFCWVDQFGREGPLSDPILCPPMGVTTNGSVLEIGKPTQPPQGTVAFHLYAGLSALQLNRQCQLDVAGTKPGWDYPLHLSRLYLHELRSDVPFSPQPQKAQSWLNPIQQAIEAGKNVIDMPGSWNLYCPLVLKYDPNNFSRVIGDLIQPTKLVQSGSWASPAIIVLNQRDTLLKLQVTNNSIASIASSDFSGGQAFSNEVKDCTFNNSAQDGYGFLVDECSSNGWGNHTCSEMLFRHCTFTAARPIKLEGRQTAKIRFDDRTTLNCTGNTRYPAEVCAIEQFTPNLVAFDTIEGVNSFVSNAFRTFCGLYSNEGGASVRVRDCFLDHGCSVAFAYGPGTGGSVDLSDGSKFGIYTADRNFFRLAENPNSLSGRLRMRGVEIPGQCSILSYNLNSFLSDLDRPIAEVVTPSQDEWTARGLPLQCGAVGFNFHDWTLRPQISFLFGAANYPDTIQRKAVIGAASTTTSGTSGTTK